ncbi:MAG: DUF512 domain-containing protein [bacterium]
MLPLGSPCNLNCYFCSNRYNPAGIRIRRLPFLKLTELEPLFDFLDPYRKIVIGESATRLCEGEPLLHPQCLQVLQRLRSRFPQAQIQLTTNGLLLSGEMQRELATLVPLELVISFNSLVPHTRNRWLEDPRPERTIRQFRCLGENGVPFQASFLLAPPFLSEVPVSLKQAAAWGASLLRLLLPGGSALAPEELQGSLAYWHEQSRRVQGWRKEVAVPMILEPPILDDLAADVDGVFPGSPAALAGFCPGDRITLIDGEIPFSRVDAFAALERAVNPLCRVERQNDVLWLQLEKERGTKSGVVVSRDISRRELEDTFRFTPSSGRGLILTSELAAPILTTALGAGFHDLSVSIAANQTFGGSIRVAGLLCVQDILKACQKLRYAGTAWDWLLLPAAPFDAGRDLCGQPIESLAVECGSPVYFSGSGSVRQ